MATGGLVRSVDKSSDIIYDYTCSPCTDEGSHTEAKHFCIDCEEHFCQQCLKDHNKFAKMRAHQVLDKKAMAALGPQQKYSLPTERCGDHPHNIIYTYCPECDTICCGTCVSINHRSCEGGTYLPKAATGVQKSKAYRDTKSAMPNLLKQLNEIAEEIKCDLNAIDEESDDILNQIKEFRELLNKKLDELENEAFSLVKDKSKSEKDEVAKIMRNLENVISKLESSFNKLKETNCDNESQLFVHFKTGQKIKAEAELLLTELKAEPERSELEFRKSNELERYVNNLMSIGEIVRCDKAVTASFLDEVNVKVKEDTRSCDINCICQMDNGTILITDFKNKKLKRLSTSYTVLDHCDLPGKPNAVCSTGDDEVVVALNTQSIQFVSVRNKIKARKYFSVEFEPVGIASNAGKLYMTRRSPGGLFVYSNTGSLLKTIEHDTSSHSILSWPKHLIIGTDQTTVMVADGEEGIVTFDLQGDRLLRFSDPELRGALGICNGMNGTLFVAGHGSNNIVQLNSKGDKLGDILQEKHGIKRPYSVCWDRVNSRLVVTIGGTDCIKVYDVI